MLKKFIAVMVASIAITTHVEASTNCAAPHPEGAQKIALSIFIVSEEGGERSVVSRADVTTFDHCPAPFGFTRTMGASATDGSGITLALTPSLTPSGAEISWDLTSRDSLGEVNLKSVTTIPMAADISAKDAFEGRVKPAFNYELNGKKTEVYLAAHSVH